MAVDLALKNIFIISKPLHRFSIGMKRNMTGVGYDGVAGFVPGSFAIAGEEVAVEFLFAIRIIIPQGQITDDIAQDRVRRACAAAMCRRWKLIFEIFHIVSDSNDEHTFSFLGYAIICSHEQFRLNFVAVTAEAFFLLFKKPPLFCRKHSLYVLDKEKFWIHLAQGTKKFAIKKVSRICPQVTFGQITRSPTSSFTESGARVAADQDVRFWKHFNLTNVAESEWHFWKQRLVGRSSVRINVVRPDDFHSGLLCAKVKSSAS